MRFTEDDINEKALYILKENEKGVFETDYIEIDKSLLNEIEADRIYSLLDDGQDNIYLNKTCYFENKKKAIEDFFTGLNNHYPDLFMQRDYCKREAIKHAYLGFTGFNHISQIRLKIVNGFPGLTFLLPGQTSDNLGCSYTVLKDLTQQFFDAYFIDQAYERCEKDPFIKVYSHRKFGHHIKNYKLNNRLSVDIKSNFAYGNSGYFLVTLIYDEIKIIPYSRLVMYRYAGKMEQLRHTKEFTVSDNSWKLMIDYIGNVGNELLKNGSASFIANYITHECEELIKLLPGYLETNTYNLWEHKDGECSYEKINNEEIRLDGIDLIQFRYEKVTGALKFIDELKKLDKLISTKKYIDCIEECLIKMETQLSEKIELIDELLMAIETKIDIKYKRIDKIEKDLLPFNPIIEEFKKEEEKIRESIMEAYINEKGNYYLPTIKAIIAEKMQEKYSDYILIKEEFDNLENQLNDHQFTLHKLELEKDKNSKYKDQLTSFIEAIKENAVNRL